MDMKLRKELREFIKWQLRKGMLKNEESIIDYEVAETYLEQMQVNVTLGSVSNRRELLIAFAEFVKKDNDCITHEQQADTFISNL